MRDDDIDGILSKEQEISPTSGFVVRVMNAVRRETAAPPPIPFPWKRALPGLSSLGLALVSVFVVGIALLVRGAATQPLPATLPSAFPLIFEALKTVSASWIALALLLSLASVRLSMSFASSET